MPPLLPGRPGCRPGKGPRSIHRADAARAEHRSMPESRAQPPAQPRADQQVQQPRSHQNPCIPGRRSCAWLDAPAPDLVSPFDARAVPRRPPCNPAGAQRQCEPSHSGVRPRPGQPARHPHGQRGAPHRISRVASTGSAGQGRMPQPAGLGVSMILRAARQPGRQGGAPGHPSRLCRNPRPATALPAQPPRSRAV